MVYVTCFRCPYVLDLFPLNIIDFVGMNLRTNEHELPSSDGARSDKSFIHRFKAHPLLQPIHPLPSYPIIEPIQAQTPSTNEPT